MPVTEKRTQIYLPIVLHERVQRYAKRHGVSMAAVIRRSLAQVLQEPPRLSKRAYERDPLWRIVGMARSRTGDLSEHHDHYLYGKPRRAR